MRLSTSWTLWSTLLLLPPLAAGFVNPVQSRQLDTSFDWTAITPTPDLQYHPCYNNTFRCARLRVPLDWSQPNTSESGPFAAIAIVTLPATVPVTSPSYAGPILINPGGPGGSGTQTALATANVIQALVDVPGVRHYDIVGFDPRGVALTTPSASCYESQFDRAVDWMTGRGMPSVLTEQGLRLKFGMREGAAGLCERVEVDGEKVFRYLTTASVARDMLEIVERSHELVEGRGKGKGKGKGKSCDEEKPRLQYLGFSYGSFLGNTFASMFPGRVGRMVVDGVLDGDDYASGAWEKNIVDAEAFIDHFYRTCFDADSACPLRQSGDTSFADIRTRINALILSLQQAPLSAIHNNRVYPVTSYLVSEKIRTSFYSPITQYESLAHSLAAALTGNFTTILADPAVMAFDQHPQVCTEPPATIPPPHEAYTFVNEVLSGIVCSDSYAAAGTRDLAWADSLVATLVNQSSTVGEGWAQVPMMCSGWPASLAPPYAFAGPFGSPAPDSDDSDTPAAPMLILSTRIDHVTPLSNAFALSRMHGGSAVVVEEAVGHCALLSDTNRCVHAIVREYFHTGTVPKNGTVCEADCVPAIPMRDCPGLPQI